MAEAKKQKQDSLLVKLIQVFLSYNKTFHSLQVV